ncbi:MAG TPA: anti-sigma factor domain-containing protein, partial [Caproiciproducens sp.]|nr:anti-sigma factor domain-containing protein [Caproiciproducens sp.]
MKACVVEIRGNLAAVLTDEGCIIKVKNKDYAIGQVIELKKQAIHFSVRTAAVAASVAIVMLLGSVTAWAYYTPCTYVSLDVNPSIEYSVNRFDRVLSAQAVNSDGADILSDLSLSNKTIDEAIRDTVDQIQSDGYFKDSGGIVISTSGDDEQAVQGLAEDLKDVAQEAVKDSNAPVEVEAISVGRARVLEAQKLGTTPGRLNLVQKLQASAGEESIDLQEWLKKPVKDIMKAIKTAKKQSKSENSSGSDT